MIQALQYQFSWGGALPHLLPGSLLPILLPTRPSTHSLTHPSPPFDVRGVEEVHRANKGVGWCGEGVAGREAEMGGGRQEVEEERERVFVITCNVCAPPAPGPCQTRRSEYGIFLKLAMTRLRKITLLAGLCGEAGTGGCHYCLYHP